MKGGREGGNERKILWEGGLKGEREKRKNTYLPYSQLLW